jgi:hypothetical protein
MNSAVCDLSIVSDVSADDFRSAGAGSPAESA